MLYGQCLNLASPSALKSSINKVRRTRQAGAGRRAGRSLSTRTHTLFRQTFPPLPSHRRNSQLLTRISDWPRSSLVASSVCLSGRPGRHCTFPPRSARKYCRRVRMNLRPRKTQTHPRFRQVALFPPTSEFATQTQEGSFGRSHCGFEVPAARVTRTHSCT